MNFKDRLREEIEYKGISGKELAAKIGISYSTFLSYIDARGVLPNVETAVKIAEVLGVTVEYLVNGHDSAAATSSAENKLLAQYRYLSEQNKSNLIKIAEILA